MGFVSEPDLARDRSILFHSDLDSPDGNGAVDTNETGLLWFELGHQSFRHTGAVHDAQK